MQYLEKKMNDLIKKVRDGDLDSIHTYALILINGDGVEINVKKGFWYLKMAADNGNEKSMLYGKKLFKGKGIVSNQKEAMCHFRKADDQRNIDSLKIIKNLVFKLKYFELNTMEKEKYLKILVDIEDIDGMCQYACILMETDKKSSQIFQKISC